MQKFNSVISLTKLIFLSMVIFWNNCECASVKGGSFSKKCTSDRGNAPKLKILSEKLEENSPLASFYERLVVHCTARYPIQWIFVNDPPPLDTNSSFSWNVSYTWPEENRPGIPLYNSSIVFANVSEQSLREFSPHCINKKDGCEFAAILPLIFPVFLGGHQKVGFPASHQHLNSSTQLISPVSPHPPRSKRSIPEFLPASRNRSLELSPSMNISCFAKGDPAPRISWLFDSPQMESEAVEMGGQNERLAWSVLKLPDKWEPSPDPFFTVKCRAENPSGWDEITFVIHTPGEQEVSMRIAGCVVLLGFVGNVVVYYFCWKHLFGDDEGEQGKVAAISFLKTLWRRQRDSSADKGQGENPLPGKNSQKSSA